MRAVDISEVPSKDSFIIVSINFNRKGTPTSLQKRLLPLSLESPPMEAIRKVLQEGDEYDLPTDGAECLIEVIEDVDSIFPEKEVRES